MLSRCSKLWQRDKRAEKWNYFYSRWNRICFYRHDYHGDHEDLSVFAETLRGGSAWRAEAEAYLYPVSCWKLLCCSRSSLRADRLAEKSSGRDVSRFQLRSSFSRKDKEKKACGKKDKKKDSLVFWELFLV